MFFFKRKPKIRFACTKCGKCCSEFSINITHLDMIRIMKRLQLDPIEFISFAQAENSDREAFISGYIKKILVLRKTPIKDSCIFLSTKNLCLINDFKPIICKTWPFDIDKEKNLCYMREYEKFIRKHCKYDKDDIINNVEDIFKLIKIYYKERKEYIKLVNLWNSDKISNSCEDEFYIDNSSINDFIDFILYNYKKIGD